MEEYEASWPEGFHQSLKKRVHTMKECKKKTRTDTAEQFDSGLIFARALGVMNSRDIRVDQVLSYELASVPTSMFEGKTRDLLIAKSKSILKNKLQVEQSARASGQPDALVIDGCAILWVVHGAPVDYQSEPRKGGLYLKPLKFEHIKDSKSAKNNYG